MIIPIFQVDAFTNQLFKGNPAAVCPLDAWLDDSLLQSIAAENNLSETAFLVKKNGYYEIRWMTPLKEVDLCGHATLASSFVIFEYLEHQANRIVFQSKSGQLIVEKENSLISMNFPAFLPESWEAPAELLEALNPEPVEVLFHKSFVAVFDSEEAIRLMEPKIDLFLSLDAEVVIITAPGETADFISRVFAPRLGIDEDPVTGFAHTILTPYWAERLKKTKLHAFQLSKRGGELFCEHLGERVKISGEAVLYSTGKIFIP